MSDYKIGKSDCKLNKHQIKCVKKAVAISKYNPSVLNVSVMGAGKTPMTIWYAFNHMKCENMVVICPASVVGSWEEQLRKFGVHKRKKCGMKTYIESYTRLAGSGTETGSRFLEVTDYRATPVITKGKNGKKKKRYKYDNIVFALTKKCKKLIKSRTLFVFDECYKMKNLSSRTFGACSTIIDYSKKKLTNKSSRCFLLCATPGNMKQDVEYIFRALCITSQKSYVGTPDPKEPTDFTGLREIIKFSRKVDKLPGQNKNRTTEILEKYQCEGEGTYDFQGLSIPRRYDLLLELWARVRGFLLCIAEIPERLDKNGESIGLFRNVIIPIERDTYRKAAREFRNIWDGRDKKGNKVASQSEQLSRYTKSLQAIESAKYPEVADMALYELGKNKDCKIVISVWYRDTSKRIYDLINSKGYAVEEFNGKFSLKKRQEIIDRFQEDNNKLRVIICSAQSGSVGISLDDKTGNHPRIMFALPNFDFTLMQQLTGRTLRNSTVVKNGNKVDFRFVYGAYKTKSGVPRKTEATIFDSMINKTSVATLIRGSITNMRYPGDMETVCYIKTKDGYDQMPWEQYYEENVTDGAEDDTDDEDPEDNEDDETDDQDGSDTDDDSDGDEDLDSND